MMLQSGSIILCGLLLQRAGGATTTLPPPAVNPAVTLGGGVNALGDGNPSTPTCASSYGDGWQAVMSADMRKWCGCSADVNVGCVCAKLKAIIEAAGTTFDGTNGVTYGLRDGHVFAGKDGDAQLTTGDDESTMHGRSICKDYGAEFVAEEDKSDPTGNGLEGGLWKLLLFLLAALLLLACCMKLCKCCDKGAQKRRSGGDDGPYGRTTPRQSPRYGDTTDEETGEHSSGSDDYHTPRGGRGAPQKHSCPCCPCFPCCKPKKKPVRRPDHHDDQQPLVDPNTVAVDRMVMTSQGAMVDETRYTNLGSLGTIVQESVHGPGMDQQLPAAVNYMR